MDCLRGDNVQSLLPLGDCTPVDFVLEKDSFVERAIKKPLRRYVYPPYNILVTYWISLTCKSAVSFKIDRWLWGQRGNDFAVHRRRINRLYPLEGKEILIAGCGTARDIPSWLAYQPASVIGIDYFSYEKAWRMRLEDLKSRFPRTTIGFEQGDLSNLEGFGDERFDVIGSDAVFEHVKDLSAVLREFRRALKPGGLLYASFGPLWNSWGGDHISGYDGLSGGYNHLLLSREEYQAYLDAAGTFVHSEQDGRTWIRHGLFSYLKPKEYIDSLESNGFERMFVSAIIDPRAVQYRDKCKEDSARLASLVPDPWDLMISALVVIFRKQSAN